MHSRVGFDKMVIVYSTKICLLFWQMYAPTTLAPARDFCTLRYTTILEDGNLVVGNFFSTSMFLNT